MIQLPPEVRSRYRPATGSEVRSWSFGAIEVPRRPGALNWQDRRGTLDDERTFGPLQDLRCPCGKYEGRSHEGMICDRCGVKVTTRDARRRRFGHIDLRAPIPHPVAASAAPLEAVPVLPAAFRESPAGISLDPLYEEILVADRGGDAKSAGAAYARITALCAPALILFLGWTVAEADAMANAMALAPIEADEYLF